MASLKTFFNNLTPISTESWDQFSALFTPKVLKKGHYFIIEAKRAKEIAFLENGIIRSIYRDEEAFEYNKHFFINPCFIGGYSSLITGYPNQIIHLALTDCNILVARFTDLQKLYETCPDIERGARILANSFSYKKNSRKLKLYY
ncbi:hypothetical protein DSM03_1159 [Leeuwenhoekiella aestuarii]|uniref:Cyclic nucleotide-binding domain-containing protein n=1 Tax=Leeuwenhoekiella aestuarii TaxID=2249426 RepID=A0A4Q0NN36_9FLAO|nr:cyclic nucleotide-binding domain-containing protein [Leeuwenhoekiella aestuarii]RXG11215.1 hypothetical protein DSM04_1139 [Leeuwenhoekiella aestuarii]RXG11581.1 hypothetical protein DSM03_1159 [Leeuwenhoekiella aestuarii]